MNTNTYKNSVLSILKSNRPRETKNRMIGRLQEYNKNWQTTLRTLLEEIQSQNFFSLTNNQRRQYIQTITPIKFFLGHSNNIKRKNLVNEINKRETERKKSRTNKNIRRNAATLMQRKFRSRQQTKKLKDFLSRN